jgi:RNA polymerase sigma-70 factor (ECF subfamily)
MRTSLRVSPYHDAPADALGPAAGPDDARQAPLAAVDRAFSEQVLPHRSALCAAARVLCGGNGDEASDLVQDTFERALRRFDAERAHTCVRAWLFTIAHNLFIDRCRRRRRVPMAPLESIPEPPCPEPEAEDPPPAWTGVSSDQLDAAVARLDEDFRVAFTMFEVEGADYTEIARRLGISKATVGTRLHRARRRLRALLAAAAGGP